MVKQTGLLILFMAISLIAGCQNTRPGDPAAANIQPSQVYYTQFSLFQEKNNFRTTNYRRGILVPVNTAFTLVDMDNSEAQIRLLDSGRRLNIENVKRHTGENMYTAFTKIGSQTKLDLTQFTSEEQIYIQVGKAAVGMSRKAVLAAIGYPPITETPDINGDVWTYWASRFDRFVVHFKNNKVERIVD